MIYADHAATTFVSEEARAAALPFFVQTMGMRRVSMRSVGVRGGRSRRRGH